MPNLPAFTMPRDAADKAEEAAKTRDTYADLTDEERADEDLPPRVKADAAVEEPEKKPDAEPEKKPEPKVVEEAVEEEEEVEDDPAAIERLFEEIAGINTKLDEALGEEKPAKTEKEADLRLKAALESDDPQTQYLAQQLQAANERLDRIENEATAERQSRQLAKDDAEFDAVQKNYLIDGQPMTDEQVEKVENYIIQNPDVGRRLSIEQLTRVVFPTAARAAKPAAPKPRPAGSTNGNGPAVATIVTEGSPGGAGAEAHKPGPYPSIESAVKAGGKAFGWTR
jgi:hypothetical protein